MNSVAIVVSGLPASGKSTVGKQIASELGYCFLDKDDFLESLFEQEISADSQSRQVLSRQSDKLFQAAAEAENYVVLVSHWRPSSRESSSGTPSGWIAQRYDTVLELYCDCPRPLAAKRFVERRRHPAHGDSVRSAEAVEMWLQEYDGWFPLNLGEVISIDTQTPASSHELTKSISYIIEKVD